MGPIPPDEVSSGQQFSLLSFSVKNDILGHDHVLDSF